MSPSALPAITAGGSASVPPPKYALKKASAVRKFAFGLTNTAHPLLVHIIPIRRCNIDCGYCNEYDKVSQPVPTEVTNIRWMIEELRVSFFAQNLGTPYPVSDKRVQSAIAQC